MSVTGYLTDATDDTIFPIRVDVAFDIDSAENELVLSRNEALEYIDVLQDLIDKLDERYNRKVRVAFDSGSERNLYTYRDPSGELKVGDKVLVSTSWRTENAATVKEIGDGGYTGLTSDVIAKLERVEL